jgi:hypothetical protein
MTTKILTPHSCIDVLGALLNVGLGQGCVVLDTHCNTGRSDLSDYDVQVIHYSLATGESSANDDADAVDLAVAGATGWCSMRDAP